MTEVRSRVEEAFPNMELIPIRKATKFLDPKKESRWLLKERSFPRYISADGMVYVKKERFIEWLSR